MTHEEEPNPHDYLHDYYDPNMWGEKPPVSLGELVVFTKTDLHSEDDLREELNNKDSHLPGVVRALQESGKVGTFVRKGAQKLGVLVADNWDTIGLSAAAIASVAGGVIVAHRHKSHEANK